MCRFSRDLETCKKRSLISLRVELSIPTLKRNITAAWLTFTRSAFRWKDKQVWLAKCREPLAIRWSRQLPLLCSPSTITVKLDASGRWHVSLLVDDETIKPLPKSVLAIGLDVGINSLIATSNGDKVTNPKHFKNKRSQLKRVQKALSRKQKGSINRHKQRQKVAIVRRQISDSRNDFLHKLTTQLVRENQTIVVEDLAIKNLVKNHKLAQSISDASWGELIRQLEYKCHWYGKQRVAGVPPVVATANPKGRTLVKIDRWFPSSKRCGNCGHVVDKLPLSVRFCVCPKCQTHHDRDINAAKNILAAGLAVIVCGANVRPDRHESKGQLRNTRKGQKQKAKS